MSIKILLFLNASLQMCVREPGDDWDSSKPSWAETASSHWLSGCLHWARSVIVNVEELGHLVQIRVLLAILDYLRRQNRLSEDDKQLEILIKKIKEKTKAHRTHLRCSLSLSNIDIPPSPLPLAFSLTFLAMGILLKTFHRMMPTTTLSRK